MYAKQPRKLTQYRKENMTHYTKMYLFASFLQCIVRILVYYFLLLFLAQ